MARGAAVQPGGHPGDGPGGAAVDEGQGLGPAGARRRERAGRGRAWLGGVRRGQGRPVRARPHPRLGAGTGRDPHQRGRRQPHRHRPQPPGDPAGGGRAGPRDHAEGPPLRARRRRSRRGVPVVGGQRQHQRRLPAGERRTLTAPAPTATVARSLVRTGDHVAETSWGKVVLVCAAGVPAAIALGKLAPVAPLVRSDLGLSLPQLGWAVSAITAVAALLGMPAGAWTRRVGQRRTLLAGLAVLAVAGGAGATAAGLGMLVAARPVEGVGYQMVVVAAPDLLVRLTRGRDRAAALALWGAVIPVGLAIGGAAGGTLAQAVGWRGWLGVAAALPLLAAVPVAAAIPPDPPAAGKARGGAPPSRA